MDYKHNPKLTENAKALRKSMTKEERRLWYEYLRSFPVRFLRQKVIDEYVVDFYCAKAKLVIELDGSQHYDERCLAYDNMRTEQLKQRGLTVLRIPNNEINHNFEGVCTYIENAVAEAMEG